MEPRESAQPDQPDRVVIRDKRRIDPVTGEARKTDETDPAATEPAPTGSTEGAPSPAAESAEVRALQDAVAERTADLQRLQAEYANYRKRAERERLAAGEIAVGNALTELLPVLDDIDRAREHGDLTGALKAIAEKVEGVATKLGLEAFGASGDPFDPSIHEAVMHAEGADVDVPTCTTVMRKGYKHGERLLRPAMVGVTDPVTAAGADDEK
jgi:molecular chaperone GrpE